MKKLILTSVTTLVTSISLFAHSQKYTYWKRQETMMYKDSYGNNKESVVDNVNAKFDFVFEDSRIDGGTLFTIYIDGKEYEWYTIIKNLGGNEKNGKYYYSAIFFTSSSPAHTQIALMHTANYSEIIIIYPDGRYFTYYN